METELLRYFWHPVCTEAELAAADGGTLGVTLLGQGLVVAVLDGTPVAFPDRCLHRSARLSLGWVDDGCLRCAYHGWKWAHDGRCVEIPATPDAPIPSRARLEQVDCDAAYGLVWARLDGAAGTSIPRCRLVSHPGMRVLMGEPYTWATDPFRRIENYTDMAHFAWVHDGTLGRRDHPVPPPVRDMRREQGELRFEFVPDWEGADRPEILLSEASYRMPMPCTVDVAFAMPGGATRALWITASPVAPGVTRSFWLHGRTDLLDGDDAAHLDEEVARLAEDEPVVTGHDPVAIPLDGHLELSVRTDNVSIEYRRWLRELRAAAALGSDVLADLVSLDAEEPAVMVGPPEPAPHVA